jgi:hypothetical protein
VLSIFQVGSHELFPLGWPQITILLISASRVAGITGMSYQRLTVCNYFFKKEFSLDILNQDIAILI